MSDVEELSGYVEVWRGAVDDLLAVLESLTEADWDLPTDLPGWDVRAVAAHVAHLERVLATGEEETAEIGTPAHVTGLLGHYTEIGVVNRRTASGATLIEEIRTATQARHAWLLANLPDDASAVPERIFGGVPWSWRTLLRNRPLDVWMHEQDVRRAIGRPGGLSSPAARHTIDYLLESFGYVVGKRAGAPSGTTAVLSVTGHDPVAVEVDASGRAQRIAVPEHPTVHLSMDPAAFTVLAGGRSAAEPGAVQISGDADLGERIVAGLGTTP